MPQKAKPVITVSGIEGKICTHCTTWLPLAKFSAHQDSPNGKRNICNTCSGRYAYKTQRLRIIANVRAYQKKYPEKHKMRKRAAERKRHGKIVVGKVTTKEYRQVFLDFSHRCAYCGVHADTADHVQPLSKGGEHAATNLVPACKSCNFAKHDKPLMKWLKFTSVNDVNMRKD